MCIVSQSNLQSMMYLSSANFSHVPTWEQGWHWTLMDVSGHYAPLNKICNSGMLQHTFRSSETLGEAAKNVIHLLHLLKC